MNWKAAAANFRAIAGLSIASECRKEWLRIAAYCDLMGELEP